MSIGYVARGSRHRVVVEVDSSLADAITAAAARASTSYRRVTASDIVREAVARFVLPSEETIGFQSETKSSAKKRKAGSLS